MRVIGILSWFDESPTWLAASVAGFARFCDAIVAVDGAYQLFPGGRPRSHPQQVEAITTTAEAAGVGCLVYQPSSVWYGNEVEKRNKCLDLAGTLAEDGDWLCIFDADYHVLWCQPEIIRAELEATECEVGSYLLLDGKDFQSTPALEEYAAKTYIDHEWTCATRDLYRWNPTLRVGPTHYAYSVGGGIDITVFGDPEPREWPARRWLRTQTEQQTDDCLALGTNLVVYHRRQDRSERRRRDAEQYYHTRNATGIEVAA